MLFALMYHKSTTAPSTATQQALPPSHSSFPFFTLQEYPGEMHNIREQTARSFTIFLHGRAIFFPYDVISLGQKEGLVSLPRQVVEELPHGTATMPGMPRRLCKSVGARSEPHFRHILRMVCQEYPSCTRYGGTYL